MNQNLLKKRSKIYNEVHNTKPAAYVTNSSFYFSFFYKYIFLSFLVFLIDIIIFLIWPSSFNYYYYVLYFPNFFWYNLNFQAKITFSSLHFHAIPTLVSIFYFHQFQSLKSKNDFVFVPIVISQTEIVYVANGVHHWHTKC